MTDARPVMRNARFMSLCDRLTEGSTAGCTPAGIENAWRTQAAGSHHVIPSWHTGGYRLQATDMLPCRSGSLSIHRCSPCSHFHWVSSSQLLRDCLHFRSQAASFWCVAGPREQVFEVLERTAPLKSERLVQIAVHLSAKAS